MKIKIGDKPEFEKVKNENSTKPDGSFLIDEQYFIKQYQDPAKLLANRYFKDVITKFDHDILKSRNQNEIPKGVVYALRDQYLDE